VRRGRVLLLFAGLALGSLVLFIVRPLPGRSYRGPLPEVSDAGEVETRLGRHVRVLAERIGERNTAWPERLESSARYLEGALRDLSYTVKSQTYAADGELVRNIEVEVLGVSRHKEIVVVGAHYDSVRESPGADDNASGVAALLEISRLLAGRKASRTLRFVLFVNEEPPFFMTERMGSRVYTRRAAERGEQIVAMLCLETIGFYTDASVSQSYPFPLQWLYPSTGDFVAFVSNLSSRGLLRRCVASFRRHAAFPSQGLVAPSFFPGVSWSDHGSFWEAGFPAIMVTDTAFLRYPHYHTPGDTPSRLRLDREARVVLGLSHVLEDLLSEPS